MLVYPQLATGALSQFPVQKRRRLRTVVNTSLDGRAIKLTDPGAETTEWQLAYAGLTDDEVAALQEFFAATEGTLNSFTFLDPTGNLLAWSDKLDNAAWAKDPFFSIAGGIADPAAGRMHGTSPIPAPALRTFARRCPRRPGMCIASAYSRGRRNPPPRP